MTTRGITQKTIAITGGSSGLGFFTGVRLAASGARVVLLCRDLGKAHDAVRAIGAFVPGAKLDVIHFDASSQESARTAGAELTQLGVLDALILNAGIVRTPHHRTESFDGDELVLATNVLGHFTLAASALAALENAKDARVVSVGSIATFLAPLRVDDLQLVHHYSGWQAYAQSKILLASFGFELNRRLVDSGSGTRSVVAHPGYSISGRTPTVPGVNEPSKLRRFVDNLQAIYTQGKDAGSAPIERAVVDDNIQTDVDAGIPVYFGPAGLFSGPAVRARPSAVTMDEVVADRVWSELELITGTTFLRA